MVSARENSLPSQQLKPTDYTIAGNVLRAYFDTANKLVFVIDYTTNADKQNVMLVLDGRDNRKWDDILSNDYGIELETIRPKVDNKYQKLDIEYNGLSIYNELIHAYNVDDDMDDILNKLHEFRITSVRRSAQERIAAAQRTIENAKETIARTNETISELNAHRGELTHKLSDQRGTIGREPTKQSAAKILRTESQIDATDDKIARARRRITNAQRRIEIATADINSARAILDNNGINNNNNTITEQGETMADDEVKPLFDTDPEIMDDNIAFKPIDFGQTSDNSGPSANNDASDIPATEPLSFTPPVSSETSNEFRPEPVPEFDDMPAAPELDETFNEEPAPVLDTIRPAIEPEPTPTPRPEAPQPPVIDDEPMFRPASPVTGQHVSAPEQQPTTTTSRHPGFMYYVLLIALIILSVFTLWMYQKSTKPGMTPEIISGTNEVEKTPVIIPEPVISEPIPEQIADTAVDTPSPIIAPEPTPVIVEPEPVVVEPEPVVVTPAADFTIKTLPPAQVEPIIVEPEIAAVIDKPEYNVSQNENMFVSESDYISETSGTCPDGTNPDAYGCCTGEEYTMLDDGVACCSGDECYPPLF